MGLYLNYLNMTVEGRLKVTGGHVCYRQRYDSNGQSIGNYKWTIELPH